VVIACLPAGVYATNSAARVARDMLRTFTGLRFGLMVGIGGGIPNLQKGLDIRLGDVVISQPDGIYGGVVQYDLGNNFGDDRFKRKGFLNPPPTILLAALATLKAEHDLDDSQAPDLLAQMFRKYPTLIKREYGFPGQENDILYCPQCDGLTTSALTYAVLLRRTEMSKTVCTKALNEEILCRLFHEQLRPLLLVAYELGSQARMGGWSGCTLQKRANHVTRHRLLYSKLWPRFLINNTTKTITRRHCSLEASDHD
jgi:hypothetical protein